MIKKINIIIIICCFFNHAFSIEIPKKNIEKEIYKINSQLSLEKNKINYLTKIINERINKKTLRSKNDNLVKLNRAKNHLLMGEIETALDEVNKVEKYIDLNDIYSVMLAYKIKFEANRRLENYKDSIGICKNILVLSEPFQKLFDDKWKMLCSISFLKESKKNKSMDFKNNLILWSESTKANDNIDYYEKSKLINSMSIRNYYNDSNYSKNYLEKYIYKFSEKNKLKSNLIISLMNFELGEKNKAFSDLKKLVFTIDKKNIIDDKALLLSELTLARINSVYGNYSISQNWYQKFIPKYINNNDFLNKIDKNKINIELSYVFYKQKKYEESEKLFEEIINNFNLDKFYSENINYNSTKFILYNLRYMSGKNKKEYLLDETTKFYKETENDFFNLKNMTFNNEENFEELKKKIIQIIYLNKKYGLHNINSIKILKKYNDIESFNNLYERNLSDLLNAINSIYYNSSYLDSITISCIDELNNNINYLKEILKNIDNLSFSMWNNKNINNKYAIETRNNYLINLGKLSNDFIFSKSVDDKIENFKLSQNAETLLDSIFEYKILKIENEKKPLKILNTIEKYEIYKKITYEIYNLHKKYAINNERNIEYIDLQESWRNLFEIIESNIKLLNYINKKTDSDKESFLKNIENIYTLIKNNKHKINSLKENFNTLNSSELKNIVFDLERYINKYRDKIAILIASINKYEYFNYSNKISELNENEEDRKELIKSLENTSKWGLFK
jgi:chromosome segregation protein